MDIGLSSYFTNKSIQRSYQFRLSIFDGLTRDKYFPNDEKMPEILDYHCLSVTIPNFSWKKEIQYIGILPRSFPIISFDGLEINLVLEEDDEHTIQNLINWLQRRIIQPNGLYVPPGTNRLTEIRVDIVDNQENVVSSYSFPNAYFLKSNDVSMEYSNNDTMKYEIIFGSDFQEFDSTFNKDAFRATPIQSSPFENPLNVG